MNQKEKFVEFLIDSTLKGEIAWKSIGMQSSISQYITNPDMISQIFYSPVKENDIFLVIQKYLSFFPDSDLPIEQFVKFLLVLNANSLVYSVYESEVSEDMLNTLAEEIRGKHESAFFENFMKK